MITVEMPSTHRRLLLLCCTNVIFLLSAWPGVLTLQPVSVNLTKTVVNITYESFSATPQDAIFTCNFEGDPQPNVNWFNSSGEMLQATSKTLLSHFANSSTLQIVNVTIDDHGSYICNASNNHSFESKSGTLNVIVHPTILAHPESKAVPEGSDVTFTCSANGFPTPEITWKKGSAILTNSNSSLYSSDGRNITLANVKASNTANYSCVASNGNSVTSNAAQLTVQYIRQPTVQPSQVTLNESSLLSIECSSNSIPAADFTWLKYDSSGSPKEIAKSNVLSIPSVNRTDAGIYFCNTSNIIGWQISENVSVSVQYIDEPTFNATNTVIVNETAPLYVSCTVASNPAAQYKWTTSSGIVISNSPVLAFDSVSRSNATTYQCTVSNAAGSKTSKNLNVNVQYIDEPTINSTNIVTVNETAPLYVSCSAASNPAAQYKWTTLSGTVVSNSAVLAFDSVSRSNATAYQCTVLNEAGSKVSKNVNISVQFIDEPTLNTSYSITLNETANLYVSCSAPSNPAAQYMWTTASGLVVSNTNILAFDAINRRNGSTYQCKATNAAGVKMSKNLSIDIQFIDKPMLNTSYSITLNETANLYVSCSAASNPAAQFSWTTASGQVVSNTNILAFNSINRRNGSAYQCKATNAAEMKTSKNLSIDVHFIDKPTLNTSYSITLNETASLYADCSAASNPAAQYTWTTASGQVVSNTNILAFNSINRRNGSSYQCKATNAAGVKMANILAINVHYIDKPMLSIPSANITLNETAPLSVNCSVNANPVARYVWTTSSGKVVSNSAVLAFNSINRSNESVYQCTVSNAAGSKTSKSLSVVVQYIDEPKLNTSTSITLNETSKFSVRCSVTSSPSAQYAWTTSGKVVSNSPVLAFDSINRRNASAYECTVSNAAGVKKASSLTIDVQYIDKPTFNTSNSITLIETASFYANCSATANPSAVYEWTTSSGRVVSNSPFLAFASVNRSDSSSYQCKALNAAGSKFSDALTIHVQYIDGPTFNTSTGITLNETDPFYVSCSLNSNLPATYEWTLKSGTVVSNSPVLSFNSVNRSDENSYQCTVKNEAGTKMSEFLSITVQYIDGPTLSKPNNIVMNETASLSVTCSAKSKPNANYVWTTKSGKFVSNGANLSFASLNRSDSNEYECKASNAAGSKTSSKLTINVQYIDVPTFNTSTSITMNETGQLYVSCSVTSNPSSQYEWTTSSGKHISNSARLAFDSISRRNDSVYQCKAMNAAGSKISTSLAITVQYLDPPVITTNGTLSNGTSASISCSVDGKPQPAISWQKDAVLVKRGNNIQWKPILTSDTGNYSCHVSNAIGIKTRTEIIIVKYPPVITVTPSASLLHVAINSSLSLTCNVLSEPVSNVTWKKNNLQVRNGKSTSPLVLVLGRLQHSDTAGYSCTAVNSEGQKYIIKQVVVQGPPDPPTGITTSQHGSRWIQLRWTAPSFVGNSPITTYNVRYGENTTYKSGITENVLSYNFTNLKPFTTYYFRLVVLNSQGSSSPAYFDQKTKTEDPPKPTGLPKSPAATSPYTATIALQKFSNDFGIISFYQVIVMKKTSQSTTAPTSSLINLNGFSSSSSSDPYITAEFSSSVFDQSDSYSFVIGDKRRTNRNTTTRRKRRAVQDYYNAPLLAESTYKAFYRAFIDDIHFTSTDWIEFKTKEEPGLSGGAIAGIVIGCLILVALVAFALVFYKRRNEPEEESEAMQKHQKSTRSRPSFLRRVSQKTRADPREPVPLGSFETHVKNLKANSAFGFSQEYGSISREYLHPYSHSSAPVNGLKNRYANIHAYDHSRVILSRDENPGSDYINADYIHGYNRDMEYIAAQGPLPETIADFWRMIWEQKCVAIVMLTNVTENGRPKCAQYWPSHGSLSLKDLTVNVMEVLDYPDHVIRTYHVTKIGQSTERTIKQFHYTNWPDHGVPSDASALFSLIKKVNRWRASCGEKFPLVVHCSAGVGRTGTYIVLDTQINRVTDKQDATIYQNVLDLREQRYLMVQTEDQFAYIHYALLEYIKSGDTEIEAHELRDYIRRKTEVDTVTGSTGLMDEFVALARAENKYTFNEASKMSNQTKNRYKNVYPYDSTRVRLSNPAGMLAGSDYINASHIDGYIQQCAFIATQAPLQTTFEDFWRMIWEQDCRSIVMLSKELEAGKVKVHRYWPNEPSAKSGNLIIELQKETEFPEYTLREFKLTNSEEGQSHVIRHYQYTAWPENAPPESAFGIIDLIGQVSKWNTTVGNKTITVHCSAGVGRTGVFIALTNLIERLKTEAVVDVYQSVKKLRQQRTAMVQTRDQYEFCYRALQEYLDSFDHYSNFE